MSDKEILKEAKERIELAYNSDRVNREEMISDLRFAAGFHWDEDEVRNRGDRPTLTIDKVNQHIKLATGDIRNNPPAIEILPVDNKSDTKVAGLYSELIRQIEYHSGSDFIYSYAGYMSAACGLGAWRLTTQYVDDSTFDQEIVLKHIPNPASVYFDPDAVLPDKSDAKFVLLTEMMSREKFKETYPGKQIESIEELDVRENRLQWYGNNKVRIAEYWYKKPVKKYLVQLQDGTVREVDEPLNYGSEAMQSAGITAYREVNTHDVYQVIISGAEVLREPRKWPGKYLPIFIVTGEEIPLEDHIYRSSVVRRAKGPQKMYNLMRSTAAETIALAPKQPYIATWKQIGEYQEMWQKANQSSTSVLLTDIDPDFPGGIPSRQRPADPPAAIWQEAAMASDDIKSVTGIYDAGLGAASNETSGKAIIARQKQGEISNSDYNKKTALVVALCGRALVDLIPKIYDSERVVRLMGENGEHRFETINEAGVDDNGNSAILNDLSVGRFDVRVKTGPSYASRRVEAIDKMIGVLESNPNYWPVIGDLLFQNLDIPDAEKIAKRIKRTIPRELLTEEELEGMPAQQQPGQPTEFDMNIAQQKADMELQETAAKLEDMAAGIAKKLADARRSEAQAIQQEIENEAAAGPYEQTGPFNGFYPS